jgi:mevalonate kinase
MSAAPRLHPHASACGKVILLGEHAVVYGEPALAAALPGALTLRATPRTDPRAPLQLHVPAWGLDLDIAESAAGSEGDAAVARAVLEVLSTGDGPLRGWTIHGETRLPPAAGCGSSAALSVALARLCLGPAAPIDEVVELSLAGERVFHGEPSGVDSYVSAAGGVVRFVRGQPPVAVAFEQPVELVVVPSGLPRQTAALVERVRAIRTQCPTVAGPVIRALGASVDAGIAALERHDLTTLGALFSMTHELLSSLGVSTRGLDELCATAREVGAHGAKLTGAGGGGSILALPGPAGTAPLLAAFGSRSLPAFAVTLRAD